MQTKQLCVLIHIWTKGEAGASLNRFKPSSKIFYWPVQGGTNFTGRSKAVLLLLIFYVFFLSCVCYAFVRLWLYVLVVTCWERADLLALVCDV